MYRKSWLTLLCGIAFLIPTSEQYINLTLRRTRKFIPPPHPPWYLREGGWYPSPEFFICGSILKPFSLKWKAFDLLNKIRYMVLGWWRCWGRRRHKQCSPSWILPRIRNQVKTARNDNFFVLYTWLYMKYNTYISTLHDFSHKIYFYC